MKAVVAASNQEKAPVWAFSMIVQLVVEPMDSFTALIRNVEDPRTRMVPPRYQAITDYPYEEEEYEYEYPWYWRDSAETTSPAPEVPVTNLTTEAEWEVWKAGLDMREGGEQRSRQLALFIFCSLHYPDADTV